jgi:hypothetical protein
VQNSTIQVTDALKPKLDNMVETVSQKVDIKYGVDEAAKLQHYKALIPVLNTIKKSAPKLAAFIDYLVVKFEEKVALMELEQLLNLE